MLGFRHPDGIFRLSGRDVHIWPVRLLAPDAVVASFERRILVADEIARIDRFRFNYLRRSSLLSRGVLRILLGQYLGISGQDVQLYIGSKGKPTLAAGSPIAFNVSHSGTFALFGFTLGCEIGIDVEEIRPIEAMLELARRFFCKEEAEDIASLSPAVRDRAFFQCWTRKEAYIKATGEGLHVPLDGFRVSCNPDEPARFIYFDRNTPAVEAWSLHDLDLIPDCAGALAYQDSPRPVLAKPLIHASDLEDLGSY